MFPETNFYQFTQSIQLKHGVDYVFGAFIKTRNLREHVKVIIKDIKAKSFTVTDNAIAGDNDWQLLLGIFRPKISDENNESEVEIRLGRLHAYFYAGPRVVMITDNKWKYVIRERARADREFLKSRTVVPGGKAEITDSMKKRFRALGYMN